MENNAKLFVVQKHALQSCEKGHCRMLWHKSVLATKLWPMLVVVGSLEVAVGVVLLITISLNYQEFDNIYSTENNKAISISTFCVLVSLALTGLMLLTSLMLERRRLMLMYIFLSTILCTYIFALSAFEMHFGILRLRSDAYKSASAIKLLNTPFVFGILTMFGSVVHFIGKIAVITYYYFKFIQPRFNTYELNCDI